MRRTAELLKTAGFLLILLICLLYLPISVPQITGLGVHDIVSGSMEPEIPVGSIVYSETVRFEDLKVSDVVVFQVQGADTAITHRIVHVDTRNRQLITKGDANAVEDLRPVDAADVLGVVRFHIPYLGYAAPVISSPAGKLSSACVLLAAVFFVVAGEILDKDSEKKDNRKKGFSPFWKALLILLALTACFAGYKVISGLGEYSAAESEYTALEELVEEPESDPVSLKSDAEDYSADDADGIYFPWNVDWPEVDFGALTAQNPDFVGWLYLYDTNVNYPVVRGADNEYYLNHSFSGASSASACLFLDCRNGADFSDSHSIIYGHHMANGSMMAQIVSYKSQEFCDAHPLGLLMTPEQNYVLEFFSGYVSEPDSEAWAIGFDGEEDFGVWLAEAVNRSGFASNVVPSVGDRILTLSTCSYEFYDARYVLHAILRPEP